MSSSPRSARSAQALPGRLIDAGLALLDAADEGAALERLWLAWAVHPEGAGARAAAWLGWDESSATFEWRLDADPAAAPGTLAENLLSQRRQAPSPGRVRGRHGLELLPDAWQAAWREGGTHHLPALADPAAPFAGEEWIDVLVVHARERGGLLLLLPGGAESAALATLARVVDASAARRERALSAAARERQRAALAGLAAALTAPGNLAEALHALQRALTDGLAAEGTAVWRMDERGELRLALAGGPRAMRDVFAAGLAGVAADAAATGCTRHATDDRQAPAPAAAVAAELPAWLATAVTAFGHPLGAIAVWRPMDAASGPFSSSDIECAQTLARMAALVLEVARQDERVATGERQRGALERRMRQLEPLEGVRELAARVAAEGRNPLASIAAFARRARKALAEDDPERDSLDVVLREAERLEAMLVEQQRWTELEPAPLRMENLNDTLQGALEGAGEVLVRRRLRLTKRLAPDLPSLLLDGPRIRRVFENVLAYALDAAPIGGRLRVESRRQGGFVQVEIAHDGPRQAGDLLEHLFVSFAGAPVPGAAVGLGVAHQIVREHGGEVRVRSEGEWSAVFACTLPIEANADRRGRRPRRGLGVDRRRRGQEGSGGVPLG